MRAVPGAVFMVADRNGKQNFSGAYGVISLDPQAKNPVVFDSVFWIASMTKLMTSISAMQCVERGLIGLDDDVSNVLHELKGAEILEGFDDENRPILRKAKNKITLRRLLTHSGGLGLSMMDPKLKQWAQVKGIQVGLTGSIDRDFTYPLIYEPGEGWAYGPGLDWAGRLVERLNGGMRLGEYMKRNIWDPLGMASTTFDLEANPDLKARKVAVTVREPSGILAHFPETIYPSPAEDDAGGGGAYSTAPDYLNMLKSILQDDGRLLKSSMIDEMFKPQLPDPKYLEGVLAIPELLATFAPNFPVGLKVNYGLGGLLNMEKLSSGRNVQSMQWGGYSNLSWWIDREGGICGTYFSQLLPGIDEVSVDLRVNCETVLYRQVQSNQ